MGTAVVLFHRDLRVHDHPALAAAGAAADRVVPVFVLDPHLRDTVGPNRLRFLVECLADLRESLRRRGADLLIRRGDPVAEALRVATACDATAIHASGDVGAYATARQRRLISACAGARLSYALHPGVTLVPPGAVKPAGGDRHYRVFTPYLNAWRQHPWRAGAGAPARLRLPEALRTVEAGNLPRRPGGAAGDLLPGGESAARKRLASWARRAGSYPDVRDDLAADATSRLSAYLHFGCLSPRQVAAACSDQAEFLRQLCWRDFHHQVLGAFPDLPRRAYRPRGPERWRDDPDALAAWQGGHTGVPVVDAGMRQLAAQGFMHNRARLITATYLVRVLGLDWRDGGSWYDRHLADADVANNYGNWQWVAGTGNDTRPNRGFNPVRQARRFDPQGVYVRRWVPELAGVEGTAVHEPWRLPGPDRRTLRYPPPLALPAARGR